MQILYHVGLLVYSAYVMALFFFSPNIYDPLKKIALEADKLKPVCQTDTSMSKTDSSN